MPRKRHARRAQINRIATGLVQAEHGAHTGIVGNVYLRIKAGYVFDGRTLKKAGGTSARTLQRQRKKAERIAAFDAFLRGG